MKMAGAGVKKIGERRERSGGRKRRSAAAAAAGVLMNRGAWTAEEDKRLEDYVRIHGDKSWRTLPEKAGLNRCGKSCRLRWLNYLRPGIKRGNMTEQEDDLILRLHFLIGNRWSLIAARLPGRTDNEIKNYWNAHLRKRTLSLHDLNRKLYQKPPTTPSAAGGGSTGAVLRPVPTRLVSMRSTRLEPPAAAAAAATVVSSMSPATTTTTFYHGEYDDGAWMLRSSTASADDLHLREPSSSPDELITTGDEEAGFDLDVDRLLDLSGGRISCSNSAAGSPAELGAGAGSGDADQDYSVLMQEEASGTELGGQAAAWEFDDLDMLIGCEDNLRGLYFLN